MKKVVLMLWCALLGMAANAQNSTYPEVTIAGQVWEIKPISQQGIVYNTLCLKNRTWIDEDKDTPWELAPGTTEDSLVIFEPSYIVNGIPRTIDAIEQNAMYRCPYTRVYLKYLANNPKSYIDTYLFYSKYHEPGTDILSHYYKVNKRLKAIYIGENITEYNKITPKYVNWAGKNNKHVEPKKDSEDVAAYYDLKVHGLCGGMEGLTTLGPITTEEGTVIIPQDVIDISADAFYNTKIRKVKFVSPQTLRTISLGAFNQCKELEQLTDMQGHLVAFDNLEKIEFAAFNGCVKLQAFTSSNLDNLTSIGNVAFRFTRNMTQFAGENFYGKWLWHIGPGAFLYSGIRSFSTPANQGASLPELKEIQNRAFYGCKNLTHFSISGVGKPNLAKLQLIGTHAFAAHYKNEDYIPPRLEGESDSDYEERINLPELQADFPKSASKLIAWGANVKETAVLRLKQNDNEQEPPIYTTLIKSNAFSYCEKLDTLKIKYVHGIAEHAFYNVNPHVVYAYQATPPYNNFSSDLAFLVDDEDILAAEGNNIPKFGTLRFDNNTYLPNGATTSQGVTVLTEEEAEAMNKKAMMYKASNPFSVFSPMFYLSENNTDNRTLVNYGLTYDGKSATGTYSLNVYRTYNKGTSNYSSLALPFKVKQSALEAATDNDLWKESGLGNAYLLYGIEGNTVMFKSPAEAVFSNPSIAANTAQKLWLVHYQNGSTQSDVPAATTLRCLADMDVTFKDSNYDKVEMTAQANHGGSDIILRGTTNKKTPLWNATNDADKALYVYTKDGWKRVFTVTARQSNIKPFRFVLLVKLSEEEKALQDRIDAAVVAYKNANNGSWDGDLNKIDLSSTDRANVVTSLGLTFDTPVVNTIDGVEEDVKTTYTPGIYNLQGQRMSDDFNTLPKGIYIINGKKVMKR